MGQNFEWLALKRGFHAGLTATADLIWPPSCPLCNQLPPATPGAVLDFCRPCSEELTVSEKRTRSACMQCGIPQVHAQNASDNPQSRDGAPRQNPKKESKFPTDVNRLPRDIETQPLHSDSDSIPLPPTARPGSGTPINCRHCYNQKFLFESICPLWLYEDRVREAVLTAKHAHHTALGATLGRRLAVRIREFQAHSSKFDLVTYIPSHVTRQLTRGGNGNQAIAEEVSRTLSVPCCQPLKITRRISKQAWLGDRARNRNVSGAFCLKKSYAWGSWLGVEGRNILLIDDVMTTGATANEVSRVLLASGAQSVSVAVIARALRS